MASEQLLLRNAAVGYGSTTVVGGINAEVRGGELVCLLGKNGAGKSTLLRSMMGLQSMLSGEVLLGNSNVNDLGAKAMATKIALVLTDRVEISNMTVYELVSAGRIPYTGFTGMLSAADKQIIKDSLGTVGVADFAQKSVLELSDGERQKVMIAKALAQQTPIIMLDEPTAHLDLINKLRLMKLLRDLAHNQGKAIIISTHDLDLALQSADKVWLLQNDNTLRSGVPEELVLNGAFEKAFAEADIAFDYTRGTFVFQDKKGKSYRVDGDDAHAFWTRKALNRNGFDTSRTAQDHIAYDHTKKHWMLTEAGSSAPFSTLDELVRHLKS
jgi:iron complex transport system ATP-binding protein